MEEDSSAPPPTDNFPLGVDLLRLVFAACHFQTKEETDTATEDLLRNPVATLVVQLMRLLASPETSSTPPSMQDTPSRTSPAS
jgi:hypothetical protein